MVKLPDAQADLIASYLGKNFSEATRPKTVVVPGPLKVNFREWFVPTLGSRPHDPLLTSDGTIYSGHSACDAIDPKTGVMKEFPLKTPQSGPHGLADDRGRQHLVHGQLGGYIGKLDPKTGDVTEYKMPDPAARDPHTPLFDREGHALVHACRAQHGGPPRSEDGRDQARRIADSRVRNPYGMVIDSKGVPFFVRVRREQGREPRSRRRWPSRNTTLPNADAPAAPHRDHDATT